MTFDSMKGIQDNKEEIIIRQGGSMTVDAIVHRPFRAAHLWCFGCRGVCPQSYDPTKGRHVPPQLATVLQRQLNLQESDMDCLFDQVFDELYYPGAVDSSYAIETEDGSIERRTWREAGITTAMIMEFGESHRLSVHALRGGRRLPVTHWPTHPQTSATIFGEIAAYGR